MYYENLKNKVLLHPVSEGAEHLKIITGYAAHTMASWHLSEIETMYKKGIKITLIVGMCRFDGISISVHEGFKNLMKETLPCNSQFCCQYIFRGGSGSLKIIFMGEKRKTIFCVYGFGRLYSSGIFSV